MPIEGQKAELHLHTPAPAIAHPAGTSPVGAQAPLFMSIFAICGVQYLWHYLDDFIICGTADSDECKLNLQMLLDICNHLGVPIADEKVEGPSTSIIL